MNARSFFRYAPLLFIAVIPWSLSGEFYRTKPRARLGHLEQWKARFAQRAGQIWFNTEQMADEIGSRISSQTAALWSKLFPAANESISLSRATQSWQLSDIRTSDSPDS